MLSLKYETQLFALVLTIYTGQPEGFGGHYCGLRGPIQSVTTKKTFGTLWAYASESVGFRINKNARKARPPFE